MKFTILATVLSMAAFAIAAPIVTEGMSLHLGVKKDELNANARIDVVARQNHGMCVSSAGGTVTQIEGC